MNKIFLLLMGLYSSFHALCQDSLQVNNYTSFFGSTGAILTPDARGLGKFKGSIGVYENFRMESQDNLFFVFGIHERLEIGIQSEIPAKPNPQLNFLFKLLGNKQGSYFGLKHKLIPATAFGINRNSAFAVASYQLKKFVGSVGYNFSDQKESIFTNLSYYPWPFLALQADYVQDTIGMGIRVNFKGIVASFIYSHDLSERNFNTNNAYWSVAYYFDSLKGSSINK